MAGQAGGNSFRVSALIGGGGGRTDMPRLELGAGVIIFLFQYNITLKMIFKKGMNKNQYT